MIQYKRQTQIATYLTRILHDIFHSQPHGVGDFLFEKIRKLSVPLFSHGVKSGILIPEPLFNHPGNTVFLPVQSGLGRSTERGTI